MLNHFFLENLLLIRCLIQSLIHADLKFKYWQQHLTATKDAVTDSLNGHHKKALNLFQHFAEQFQHIIDSNELSGLLNNQSACEISTVALIILGTPHNKDNSIHFVRLSMAAFLANDDTTFPLANTIGTILKAVGNDAFSSQFAHIIQSIDFENISIHSELMNLIDSFENVNMSFAIYWQLTLNGCVSLCSFITKLLNVIESLSNQDRQLIIFEYLKPIICLRSNDGQVSIDLADGLFKIYCPECDAKIGDYVRRTTPAIIHESQKIDDCITELLLKTCEMFGSESSEVRCNALHALPTIAKHRADILTHPDILSAWTQLICDPILDICERMAGGLLQQLLVQIELSRQPSNRVAAVLDACRCRIKDAIKQCLSSDDDQQQRQSVVVRMVRAFGTQPMATEETLVRCNMMCLVFVMRIESAVANEAMLAASEICTTHGTTPEQLIDWYKDRMFELLVSGAVANFMQHNVGLVKTFYHVSK